MSWRAAIGSGMENLKAKLFLAAAHPQVKADHSVLISRADRRNAAIEIIFPLNDLLRTLGNIGGVGERNVVGELLLDRNLRAGADGIGLGTRVWSFSWRQCAGELMPLP